MALSQADNMSCGSCLMHASCQKECEHVSASSRWKALTLSYILPFLLMLAGMIIAQSIGWSDAAIGGVAIGIVGLYYGILWLVRQQIDKSLTK